MDNLNNLLFLHIYARISPKNVLYSKVLYYEIRKSSIWVHIFFLQVIFMVIWGLYELSELKECSRILLWDDRVTGCVGLIPKEWGDAYEEQIQL